MKLGVKSPARFFFFKSLKIRTWKSRVQRTCGPARRRRFVLLSYLGDAFQKVKWLKPPSLDVWKMGGDASNIGFVHQVGIEAFLCTL